MRPLTDSKTKFFASLQGKYPKLSLFGSVCVSADGIWGGGVSYGGGPWLIVCDSGSSFPCVHGRYLWVFKKEAHQKKGGKEELPFTTLPFSLHHNERLAWSQILSPWRRNKVDFGIGDCHSGLYPPPPPQSGTKNLVSEMLPSASHRPLRNISVDNKCWR